MILVIAVALWMVWVAPYVLRDGRYQLHPAVEFLTDVTEFESAGPHTGRILAMTAHQESSVIGTQRTKTAKGAPAAERPTPAPAFRIRYGRLALALAGLLSLLTGLVSAVLLIFRVGTIWLPAGAFLAAAAAVVLLRRLAVRDRRRKADRMQRATGPRTPKPPTPGQDREQTPADPAAAADERALRPENPLFDAQSGAGTQAAAPLAAPRSLTGQDLRQAALAEAAASGDTSVRLSPEGSSWEPVQVPKPTYVEAPKAERAAPGPLDLPEAPKSAGKPSLKQGLSQGPSRMGASEAAGTGEVGPGKSQSALSNLDDVLQRRRA